MKYYIINTDRKTIGRSPHPEWIDKGFAFTEGKTLYGNKLDKLIPGDMLFAYASKIGIVAVGEVADYWDGHTYHNIHDVYPDPNANIYKIKVKWSPVISHPISAAEIKKVGGSTIQQTLYEINEDIAIGLLSLRKTIKH